METASSFFDSFIQHAEFIWWFLSTGMWQPVKDLFSLVILVVSRVYWEMKLAGVSLAWGVAQSMMEQMSFTSIIEGALNQFDSSVKDMLLFFRIPDAVYIMAHAYITRYVFAFVSKVTFGVL